MAPFAEAAGFDFLLAGARWTTLGGRLDFQGHRFESMTIMTALAAVTECIRLFPTIHTHVFHPIVAARRMVNDVNRISGGRCGINVVSGWVQSDLTMFGLEQRTPEERVAGSLRRHTPRRSLRSSVRLTAEAGRTDRHIRHRLRRS